MGSQYRSAIFYVSDSDKALIGKFMEKMRPKFKKPIVTEVRKLERFYDAEEYHQRYYEENPHAPYCMFTIKPKVDKIRREFAAQLK